MWNKKTTVFGLSVFFFAFSAYPQNTPDTDAGIVPAAQPQVQTTAGPPARFDPKTPRLTMKAVKKLLEVDIQEKLLEKKLPEELSKTKNSKDNITNTSIILLLLDYDRLSKNPELPEVTRIHPNWYKAYGEKLAKFKPIVSKLESAIDGKSPNNYFLAVRDFKKLQEECLAFLKEPMPKITKEQYSTLHKANTKQRALEYEKYLKARRDAELKAIQAKKAKAAKSSSKTSE